MHKRKEGEGGKSKAFKDERAAASPQTAAHLVPDATPSSRKGHVRTCERVFNARYITEAPSSPVPPGGFQGSEMADILLRRDSSPREPVARENGADLGCFGAVLGLFCSVR